MNLLTHFEEYNFSLILYVPTYKIISIGIIYFKSLKDYFTVYHVIS